MITTWHQCYPSVHVNASDHWKMQMHNIICLCCHERMRLTYSIMTLKEPSILMPMHCPAGDCAMQQQVESSCNSKETCWHVSDQSVVEHLSEKAGSPYQGHLSVPVVLLT